MIKRYQEYTGGSYIHEHHLGDYVKYDDHKRIVDDTRGRIEEILSSLKDNPHGWIKHGQKLQELYRSLE